MEDKSYFRFLKIFFSILVLCIKIFKLLLELLTVIFFVLLNDFFAAATAQNGVVRIISRRTGVRGLIKNIPGFIKDLSFAYLSSRILLAFTDNSGTLYVYEVQEEEKNLKYVICRLDFHL